MLRTRTKVWIGIGVVLFAILFAISTRAIDTKRIAKGEKPMFCIQMAEVADGGSKIYIGLGYKVIEYNQKDGYQGMVIGGWNLEYDADYATNQFPIITADAISPNEAYTQNEADKVLYVVSVHQKDENTILVKASSNSPFFKGLQYEVRTNAEIKKEDIKIEWTTLMGNPEASKEDQIAVAIVTIQKNQEIISKKKINFVAKAIEMMTDTLKEKEAKSE